MIRRTFTLTVEMDNASFADAPKQSLPLSSSISST
jgi:hypothetical protein